MKKYYKLLLSLTVLGFLISPAISQATTLSGPQGGTDFATTTSANIGNCLKVLTSTPQLHWTIGTCGGTANLTSTEVGFGNALNTLTGEPDFVYLPATNTDLNCNLIACLRIGSSTGLGGAILGTDDSSGEGSLILYGDPDGNGFVTGESNLVLSNEFGSSIQLDGDTILTPQSGFHFGIHDPDNNSNAYFDTSLLTINQNYQFPASSGVFMVSDSSGNITAAPGNTDYTFPGSINLPSAGQLTIANGGVLFGNGSGLVLNTQLLDNGTGLGYTIGAGTVGNCTKWVTNGASVAPELGDAGSPCLSTSTFNATGTAFNFPFWNASGTKLTATSSLTQGSSTGNIFISTNEGIGTSTAIDPLDIVASGTLTSLLTNIGLYTNTGGLGVQIALAPQTSSSSQLDFNFPGVTNASSGNFAIFRFNASGNKLLIGDNGTDTLLFSAGHPLFISAVTGAVAGNSVTSTPGIAVLSSGNVGIDTATPGTLFDIQQATDTSSGGFRTVNVSGNDSLRAWADSFGGHISGGLNDTLPVILNGNGAGLVGIGTDVPSTTLDLVGTFRASQTSTFKGSISSTLTNTLIYANASGIFVATSGPSGSAATGTAFNFPYYLSGGIGLSVTSTITFGQGTSTGYVGIGTTNPQGNLDVGGFYAPAPGNLFTGSSSPIAAFSANFNGVTGVALENTNSAGTSTDFRFGIQDTTAHYFAFAQPGINNNGTLLGQSRSSTDFIFNNGGTARNIAIGPVTANNLLFGTNNLERMRIDANGNVAIATTTEITSTVNLGLDSLYTGSYYISGAASSTFSNPFVINGITPPCFTYFEGTFNAMRIGCQSGKTNTIDFELPGGAGYSDVMAISTSSVVPAAAFDNVIALGAAGLRWKSLTIGTGSSTFGGALAIGTSTTSNAQLTVSGLVQFAASSSVITPTIGGAIVSGGCDSATSSIDSSITSSTAAFITTPVNDPGTTLGGTWAYSLITAPGILTTRVCANISVTPNTTTYIVKIIK